MVLLLPTLCMQIALKHTGTFFTKALFWNKTHRYDLSFKATHHTI